MVVFFLKDDEFLVLACDGLWDKVTHEEASLFVSKLLHYKNTRARHGILDGGGAG